MSPVSWNVVGFEPSTRGCWRIVEHLAHGGRARRRILQRLPGKPFLAAGRERRRIIADEATGLADGAWDRCRASADEAADHPAGKPGDRLQIVGRGLFADRGTSARRTARNGIPRDAAEAVRTADRVANGFGDPRSHGARPHQAGGGSFRRNGEADARSDTAGDLLARRGRGDRVWVRHADRAERIGDRLRSAERVPALGDVRARNGVDALDPLVQQPSGRVDRGAERRIKRLVRACTDVAEDAALGWRCPLLDSGHQLSVAHIARRLWHGGGR